MRTVLIRLGMSLLVMWFTACAPRSKGAVKEYNKPLGQGEVSLREVDVHQLPSVKLTPETRRDLHRAIANSLAYFDHPTSGNAFPVCGISREQVVASLHALDGLVTSAATDEAFNEGLTTRFRALMSVGCDDQGTVLFTGYFTPIWNASLTQDATYRFPLYTRPKDLVLGPKGGDPAEGPARQRLPDGSMRAYPDRAVIDGSGMLRGSELVWLADAFDAYCVQVQGSAKLTLTNGTVMEVGFDGTNNYSYYGIGQDLVNDHKIPKDKLNFFTLREYFRQHPDEVQTYINRNPRYVFFRPEHGGPYGSLHQPVTANVTIATDKSIFPRGAPCLVSTRLADPGRQATDYVGIRIDQDAGGGIRAPGHADLYMGEGPDSERRAGSQYQEGKLFYLIVRE